LFEFVEPADARAYDRPAAKWAFLAEIDAAVADRVERGHNGELGEAIHSPDVFGVQDGLGMEILDLAAEVDFECRSVEERNGGDAAPPGEQTAPVGRHVVGERVDRAHAGNHHASPAHFFLISASM